MYLVQYQDEYPGDVDGSAPGTNYWVTDCKSESEAEANEHARALRATFGPSARVRVIVEPGSAPVYPSPLHALNDAKIALAICEKYSTADSGIVGAGALYTWLKATSALADVVEELEFQEFKKEQELTGDAAREPRCGA